LLWDDPLPLFKVLKFNMLIGWFLANTDLPLLGKEATAAVRLAHSSTEAPPPSIGFCIDLLFGS
jgi:hypothetical protein